MVLQAATTAGGPTHGGAKMTGGRSPPQLCFSLSWQDSSSTAAALTFRSLCGEGLRAAPSSEHMTSARSLFSSKANDGYGRGSRVVGRPRKIGRPPIAAALTWPSSTDAVAGSSSWLAGRWILVIRYAVDADKHPVATSTALIAASDRPVTSSTTNSGGTPHLSGTPLVPMPLVT